MKIYIVTCMSGAYFDESIAWEVVGVFTTPELAEEFISQQKKSAFSKVSGEEEPLSFDTQEMTLDDFRKKEEPVSRWKFVVQLAVYGEGRTEEEARKNAQECWNRDLSAQTVLHRECYVREGLDGVRGEKLPY